MIHSRQRQIGWRWQRLRWAMSLVLAAGGCASPWKQTPLPDVAKVGTARVHDRDTSVADADPPRTSRNSPRRLAESSDSGVVRMGLATREPFGSVSLAKRSADVATVAARRSPPVPTVPTVTTVTAGESRKLFDAPGEFEPAWTEHFDLFVWNNSGGDQVGTTAHRVPPQPAARSPQPSVASRQQTGRPTTAIRDAIVVPESSQKPDSEIDEDETHAAPTRDNTPLRRSPPNATAQYDDLGRLGFRPVNEIAQAQFAVPEPVESNPVESKPEESKPEESEPEESEPPRVPPILSRPVHIPLEGDESLKDIQVTLRNGRISLMTRNAPVQSVLNLLAQQQGVNLITSDEVTANVSVSLSEVTFEDALSSIVAIAGCTWTEQKGIVLVTKSGGQSGSPEVTGKVVQVFPLNYVSALDIEATVKGLMSPTGQVFTTQMSPTDKRRTQEHLVVEDVPSSLARIAMLIGQLDQPPRQVMIQAHILQVELKDDTRHGINWENIIKLSGSDLTLKAVGFANPAASPAAFLSFDGAHLDALVEALKSTSDTKTLASPKVIVANGQEARVQIGQRLGYFVTTTTQTSTLQNVNFLDTGVVMRVTPQISEDNRVLMSVQPEVSSGKISSLGLPETSTTEANTTVLVDDGGGMVIGGLIKEADIETQDKVPLLGDMWLIGRAFQRRSVSRVRSEIVIVLIPRIAPYTPDYACVEQAEVAKSQAPLFHGALEREQRPWEAKLPDAIDNPRRLRFYRLGSLFNRPKYENPEPLRHYFPTADEECPPGYAPYDSYSAEPVPPAPHFPMEQPTQTSDAH